LFIIVRYSTGEQMEYDQTGRWCDTFEGEEKITHYFSRQTWRNEITRGK